MTADPAGPPDAIICPWLYGDWRYPLPPLGRSRPFPPFRFDGYVRAGLGPGSLGTPAREVRAWMLKAADDALDALAAAGWELAGYPDMEFTGSLDFAVATIGGEMVTHAQQHSIALRVRFEITGPFPRAARDESMAAEAS